MSERDINKIVPVLATFCCMFSHSLHTLHDADFYGDNKGNSVYMVGWSLSIVQVPVRFRYKTKSVK